MKLVWGGIFWLTGLILYSVNFDDISSFYNNSLSILGSLFGLVGLIIIGTSIAKKNIYKLFNINNATSYKITFPKCELHPIC